METCCVIKVITEIEEESFHYYLSRRKPQENIIPDRTTKAGQSTKA